jgi:hypothetical protein
MELEEFLEAMKAFDKALDLPDTGESIKEAELLTCRGIAKQKAGKNGYIKDIKDAAAKGDKKAKNLLKSL